MKTAAKSDKHQGNSRSSRGGSASWGIVMCFSVLSLALGLLVGVFVLNSGDKPEQLLDNSLPDSPDVEAVPEASTTSSEQTGTKPSESTEKPTEKLSVEEKLKTTIQAAIETIDKKSAQMFVHSYLPDQLQSRYEDVVKREGRKVVDQVLTKKIFNEYRIHLQSALNGAIELNPSQTVAIVTYKLKELPDSGMNLKKFALSETEVVEGVAYEGLGDDLSKMLEQAAALLEEDKLQEFVENVYPISEVEVLSADQMLSRLLTRIGQPAMKKAMIRDLKEAAAASADVQGATAVITLPSLHQGDQSRTFKFDLVEGNWRFIDLAAKERATMNDLAVKLPASMKKGNSGQTIVFARNNAESEWRIQSLPDTLPEW